MIYFSKCYTLYAMRKSCSVCYTPSHIRYLLYHPRNLLCNTRYLLHSARYLLFVTRYLLFVLFAIPYTVFYIAYMCAVIPYMFHTIPNTLFAIRQLHAIYKGNVFRPQRILFPSRDIFLRFWSTSSSGNWKTVARVLQSSWYLRSAAETF